MIRYCLIAATALCLLAPARAFAWGDEGHVLVVNIALSPGALTPAARQKLVQLLHGTSPERVAIWADDVREWQDERAQGKPESVMRQNARIRRVIDDPVAKAFVQNPRNDRQRSWHFTNLPAGEAYLDAHGAPVFGTAPDDVVQMVRRCAAVLQGHPLTADEPLRAPEALRLLMHYVGDMHQPLHAGIGYWVSGPGGRPVRADLAHAPQGVNDRGGNSLLLANRGSAKFHGFWDNDMVRAGAAGRTHAQYVQYLARLVDPPGSAPWTLPGDLLSLPVQWATETSRLAGQAYGGIDTAGLRLQGGNLQGSVALVDQPQRYEARFGAVTSQQLARAGFRLAALLNGVLR
jgi:hypothetical protein